MHWQDGPSKIWFAGQVVEMHDWLHSVWPCGQPVGLSTHWHEVESRFCPDWHEATQAFPQSSVPLGQEQFVEPVPQTDPVGQQESPQCTPLS